MPQHGIPDGAGCCGDLEEFVVRAGSPNVDSDTAQFLNGSGRSSARVRHHEAWPAGRVVREALWAPRGAIQNRNLLYRV